MIIGCFALVEPFTTMERQFQAIQEMGIKHADITDNHDGASLGVEFGFAATVSLDSHPAKIRKMAQDSRDYLNRILCTCEPVGSVKP